MRAELRQRVPGGLYEIWLDPLSITSLDGERVVLKAPAEIAGWVQERFGTVLRDAATKAAGSSEPLSVVVTSDDAEPVPPGEKAPSPERQLAPKPKQLHPKYTFEQFVIGDTNRFAHAAALSAAEMPGTTYNPLFLCGPPGVGKTHLLHSIGNYVQQFGGALTVRYTTAEDFAGGFRSSLENNSIDAFKDFYRGSDVLLIDDVQFLENKDRTSEEFFHTFNSLRESGSQIVLTADRPPREMRGLHERLSQRFESGLLVEIERPDRAMRRAILLKRAQVDGLQLGSEVVDVIADRVTDTVRALEAALIRTAAYASLTGEPITPQLTQRVLDQLYGRERTRAAATPSVSRVKQVVCEYFDVTPEDLESASRRAQITWPRHVAMYLAREHSGQSLPVIGREFGDRDHTTVLSACRKTTSRIETDPEAAQAVQQISHRLLASDERSDRDK